MPTYSLYWRTASGGVMQRMIEAESPEQAIEIARLEHGAAGRVNAKPNKPAKKKLKKEIPFHAAVILWI